MTRKISQEKIYLGLVLLFAFALRAYNFFDLSYINDELSALSRTKFSNLSDLFSKGILVDGHPPLLQLFLYFWTGIFGYGTPIVKFPFLVVGMLSLYYLYNACKAFSQSMELSLVVTLFFAVNQLHVSYSSIARMYITGFLFAMALVYHWKKWLDDNSKKDFIWMIVFAVLSAYNHHFTLFFCVLVWVSGWFFVQQNQKKAYIKALLIVFITYVPCIYITYYQLFVTQGLNWMTTPDELFTEDFLRFFLHYNPVLLVIILVGLALNFFRNPKSNVWILVGFSWFFITYFIAYAYSIQVAPVLQFHLMLYAFPFLVMASFSGWMLFLDDKKLLFAGLAVCALSLFSLIVGRKHFSLFPSQSYKVLAESIKDLKQGKVLVVSDLNFDYLDFYLDDEYEYVDTLSEDRIETMNYEEIIQKYDYVICASKSEFAEAVFTPSFEPIKETRQSQGTEINVLQRTVFVPNPLQLISSIDFKKDSSDWVITTGEIKEAEGVLSYQKPEKEAWGPTYEAKFSNALEGVLALEVTYKGDKKEGKMGLVLNFYDSTGAEVYSTIAYDQIASFEKGINKSRALLNLRLVPRTATDIKAFHWKKTETSIEILDMRLSVMKEKEVTSYRTDSIITHQDFVDQSQEYWAPSPLKATTVEPFGELAVTMDKRGIWFPSVELSFEGSKVYAYEFEFLPKDLSPFTRVIVSVKQDGKTIYYTSRNLNSFFQSDGNTWVKAVIGIPQGVLDSYSDSEMSFEAMCFKPQGDVVYFKNPMVKSFNQNPYLYSFVREIKH